METNFRSIKLGKIASLQGGFAFKSQDFSDYGVPVLKIKNVKLRDVDTSEVDFVSEEVARTASRYLVQDGDLLISMTGSGPQAPNSVVGRVARYSGESGRFLINQRVGRFIVNKPDQLYLRYLFYILTQADYQWQLVAIATGSANQANISSAQVLNLDIPLPSIEEQRAIAHILGALDDKIELNRCQSATLESLARAIFKSWFVDFDPVRAKAEGRAPAAMDAATTALFPDALDVVGGREVPQGWRYAPLKEFLTLKRGYDLPQAQRESGTVPIVSSSGISGTHSTAKAAGPGLVTGRYGTIGQVFFIEGNFWPLNTTLYVQDFKQNEPRIAYYILSNINFAQFTDKAAVPGINRNHVHEEMVVLPDIAVQRAFSYLTEPFFKQLALNTAQNKTLTELRDALLPRLLSGELRVREAERLVEERV